VFATFRGTGQLNAHDEGDLIFDADEVPDDDPDAPEVISIADAIDTEGTGEVVAVEGLVTRIFGGTTVIEDGTAGIVVSRRDDVAEAAEIGDELQVIGSVGQFNGLFQLDSGNVEDFEVLSSGNTLPDPLEIGLDEVGDFQSRLVSIGGLEITGTDAATFEGGTNYEVTDGSTTSTLRIDGDSFYVGEPIPDGPFDFRGITGVFNDPQIFPLLEGDIEEAVEPTDLSIADAKDTDGTDELVAVTGTVTRVFGRSTVIQDGTGGIVVSRRQDVADAAAAGDELRVVGTVSTFNGLFQLDSGNVEGFEVLSSGNPLPDPVEITLDQVGDFQSELVLITGLEVEGAGTADFEGGTNYDVTDGSTTSTLRIDGDSFYVGEPIPDGPFDFRGITGAFNGPQIFPLIDGDITEQ
jgi:phage protein U